MVRTFAAVRIGVGVVDDEVAGAGRSADAQDDVFGHDAVRAISGIAEIERRRAEVVASAAETLGLKLSPATIVSASAMTASQECPL